MACSPDLFSGKKLALEQHEKSFGGGSEPAEDTATAPMARCQREDEKKGGISGIWLEGKGWRFGLGPNAEHMMGVSK